MYHIIHMIKHLQTSITVHTSPALVPNTATLSHNINEDPIVNTNSHNKWMIITINTHTHIIVTIEFYKVIEAMKLKNV